MIDKKNMTEEEIKLNYITPAILRTWLKSQIRMEYYFTAGKINIDGKKAKRGEAKKADYVLYYRHNLPLAVIEAKDNKKHSMLSGISQAIDYAKILKIPFAYSSNGDGFVEHNMITGKQRNININDFPSPDELWQRYKLDTKMNDEQEKLLLTPFFYRSGGKEPRYYQRIAINKALEVIGNGQDRILMVLSTGTGKTFIAFQIMWRLLKANKVRKILFIADRNILVDQSRDNDFAPLSKVMTKIENHKINTEYKVYLSLYQQLKNPDENFYERFEPDFFDLIIIDECHRSSASEDSSWHEILTYFKSAIQIGLTATPKETEDVSNINYFGKPIYTYSLKQGIQDGFLAPYKVICANLDIDIEGYRPPEGMIDLNGNPVENRLYEQNDFDRIIVIEERIKTVAKRISDYLKENDRYAKTIVFCYDIPHAERMTQALINENNDLVAENPIYIVQITGDNKIGKSQLDNFIDPHETYPVIAVTSKLMSTGVDAQTCKLVVLDRPIGSMTEFKQIIGRGTRIREDKDKLFFTILDFRKNYLKFKDPEYDGEPVMVYTVDENKEFPSDKDDSKDINNNTDLDDAGNNNNEKSKKDKYIINGVEVNLINEKVQYLDANGNLITTSIFDYSKINLKKIYPMFEDFREAWLKNKKKNELLEQLEKDGVFIECIKENFKTEVDAYDILSYLGYDKEPLTKGDRIDLILASGYLEKYSKENQDIIRLLLNEYREKDIDELRNLKVLKLPQFIQVNSPQNIVKNFGGKDKYNEMIDGIEKNIYTA